MREELLKSKRKLLGLFLACLVFFVANGLVWTPTAAEGDLKRLTDCDIQQGPCTNHLPGMDVTLDILPKPVQAMKDLRFTLTVGRGKLPSNPHIDLGMPGMNMGPNRVLLKPVGSNTYEGQGIIVRCPSGRRTWNATVTLPQVGKVEFIFDVVY